MHRCTHARTHALMGPACELEGINAQVHACTHGSSKLSERPVHPSVGLASTMATRAARRAAAPALRAEKRNMVKHEDEEVEHQDTHKAMRAQTWDRGKQENEAMRVGTTKSKAPVSCIGEGVTQRISST